MTRERKHPPAIIPSDGALHRIHPVHSDSSMCNDVHKHSLRERREYDGLEFGPSWDTTRGVLWR